MTRNLLFISLCRFSISLTYISLCRFSTSLTYIWFSLSWFDATSDSSCSWGTISINIYISTHALLNLMHLCGECIKMHQLIILKSVKFSDTNIKIVLWCLLEERQALFFSHWFHCLCFLFIIGIAQVVKKFNLSYEHFKIDIFSLI